MQPKASFSQLVRRSKLVASPLSDRITMKDVVSCGADVFIVDLVQTVPEGLEAQAYAKAREVLKELSQTGSDLLIRVSPPEVRRTLEDCWVPQLAGIVIAAERPEEVKAADAALATWEKEKGLSEQQLQIDLVLASSRAVLDIYELASSSSRVVSLTLDEDSLLAELVLERSLNVDQLLYPRGRIIIVARTFQIQAHGLGFVPGDAGLLERATAGRKIGLRGALCFNYADVPALNQGFSPAQSEVEHAIKVKKAMDEAIRRGQGAASLPGGEMVDMAMLKHAQALLRWHDAIKVKESKKQRGS